MEDLSPDRVLNLESRHDLGALLVALANAGLQSQFHYPNLGLPLVVVKVTTSEHGFVAAGADAGVSGCEVGCLACIGDRITKTDSWKPAYSLGDAVRRIQALYKRISENETGSQQ